MSELMPRTALSALLELNIDGYPIAMDWSHNGRWLAVGTAEGELWLIDAERQELQQRWQAHEVGLHQVRWHPKRSVIATSGQDGCARLWRLGEGERVEATAELKVGASGAWAEQLAWRADGGQLAVSAGRAVQVYSASGALEQQWQFPGSTVAALAWRPQGAQLAAAGYGGIVLFASQVKEAKPYQLPWKGSLLSLSWSGDARVLAATCQDNSVHFWYTKDRRDSAITGFETKSKLLAWSQNSRWLALGGGAQISVWPFDGRGPEGRSPVTIDLHEAVVTALAFAPKGLRLLSGCRKGLVCVWAQPGAENPLATLQMSGAVELAAWSPKGKNGSEGAVVAKDGRLVVWRVGQ